MKTETSIGRGNRSWRPFAIIVLVITGAFALGSFYPVNVSTTVSAQTDLLLERRISQVEQRFYLIESRLGRLEQYASAPQQVIPNLDRTRSEADLSAVRSQIDVLRLRLAELECGVAKIDERTLTPAARAARARSGRMAADACRENPNTPVTLSARP